MKLRLRGDTIRLRLKRSEVNQIAAGISVAEETRLADSTLAYRLDLCEAGDISAQFADDCLVVCVPRTKVQHWAGTEEVSLYAEQKTSESRSLSLLIEKDFSCLEPGHHRDCEDDEDTFPHPAVPSRQSRS